MHPRESADTERVDFTLRLDHLMQIERHNPLSVGTRRERTAEHCWHLAMATFVWAPQAPAALNVDHAVTLAVVHDFPELFVGDNSVYSAAEATRQERESRAMDAFAESGFDHALRLRETWREFEFAESPEALFVRALDVLLPILHNHSNISESSWIKEGVPASAVRKRIETAATALPWLAARASGLVDDAESRGALRSD